MKKYIVRYYDKSGDYCKVWFNAYNEQDAEQQARSEYWDIDRIISIEVMK